MTDSPIPPPYPPPSQVGAATGPTDGESPPLPAGGAGSSADGPNRNLILVSGAIAVVAIIALVILALAGSPAEEPSAQLPPLTTLAPTVAPTAAPTVVADQVPDTVPETQAGTQPPVTEPAPTSTGSAEAAAGWTAPMVDEVIEDGPVLLPTVAVVPTQNGSATGYDRATGATLWRVDLAPGFRSRVAVTTDHQALIMGAGTTLVSLDPISGGERWRATLPAEVRSIQIVGTDAVVSGAGYVTRIDTGPAATRWITPLTAQADSATNDLPPSRITDVGGVVIVGTVTVTDTEIALWALEPDTGAIRWQVDSLRFALDQAATPAGDVIALSWEGGVAAFETAGGQRLWDRSRPAESYTLLSPTRDGVIATEESVASLLDAASGTAVWSASGTVWGVAGDTAVLRTPEGLTGVATATGETRWQLTEAISTATVLDDRVVVVTADQRVLVVAADTGAVLTTSAITEPGFVAWYLVADENGALALPETGGPLVYVAL